MPTVILVVSTTRPSPICPGPIINSCHFFERQRALANSHVRPTADYKYGLNNCCKKSDYVFFESQSSKYIVDLDVGGKGFNLPKLIVDALVYFATKAWTSSS